MFALSSVYIVSLVVLVFAVPAFCDEAGPPTLVIRQRRAGFCLQAIDGQNHCLKDYAASKVLVVAFTCNHCPTAQLYGRPDQAVGGRIIRIGGVTLVAIEPNNPNAVRLDEMGYTDVGDSFDDMKTRAAYRRFNFPYLYDGETQKVGERVRTFGDPHLFIFDKDRKLRSRRAGR